MRSDTSTVSITQKDNPFSSWNVIYRYEMLFKEESTISLRVSAFEKFKVIV